MIQTYPHTSSNLKMSRFVTVSPTPLLNLHFLILIYKTMLDPFNADLGDHNLALDIEQKFANRGNS